MASLAGLTSSRDGVEQQQRNRAKASIIGGAGLRGVCSLAHGDEADLVVAGIDLCEHRLVGVVEEVEADELVGLALEQPRHSLASSRVIHCDASEAAYAAYTVSGQPLSFELQQPFTAEERRMTSQHGLGSTMHELTATYLVVAVLSGSLGAVILGA